MASYSRGADNRRTELALWKLLDRCTSQLTLEKDQASMLERLKRHQELIQQRNAAQKIRVGTSGLD